MLHAWPRMAYGMIRSSPLPPPRHKCRALQMTTFDCEDELEKIAAAFPTAQLLLRI